MSATVTYKGQTLTTVQNTTATLETAGTWLEDDITITDSSGSGTITVIDVPDAHGGIEKRITAVDISDTTAQAEDVASGEVFYTADGTRTVGTGGGGGLDWDSLIENAYENEDVTYGGTSITPPIPILKCRINRLTLSNITSTSTSFGYGGQWKEFYAPKMTVFGLYALRECSRMTKVYLPLCTSLGNNFGLSGCTVLEGIVMPSLDSKIGNSSFANDRAFAYGDFNNATTIEALAFSNCSVMGVLIIRNTTTAATLANINAFNGTPFASGGTGGTLYVPSALISSYEAATNWATILGYANNSIQAIEGSTYETHYADGTVIE